MQYNIMQSGTLFKQWTSVYSLDPLFTRLYRSISLYCSLAIYLHISFSVTSSKVDDKLIAQGLLELLHVEFLLCGYSVVERKGGIVYVLCLSKGLTVISHVSRITKPLLQKQRKTIVITLTWKKSCEQQWSFPLGGGQKLLGIPAQPQWVHLLFIIRKRIVQRKAAVTPGKGRDSLKMHFC